MKKLAGYHLLVVDDEEDLREIVVDELRSYGATVKEADGVASAMALLRGEAFHAVISDVRMPGGDGVALMRQIHQSISPKPKLFLCSGFHQDIDTKSLEIIAIFSKPFRWNEVLSCLVEALGQEQKKAS